MTYRTRYIRRPLVAGKLPRYFNSKYASKCHETGEPIGIGEKILYVPFDWGQGREASEKNADYSDKSEYFGNFVSIFRTWLEEQLKGDPKTIIQRICG